MQVHIAILSVALYIDWITVSKGWIVSTETLDQGATFTYLYLWQSVNRVNGPSGVLLVPDRSSILNDPSGCVPPLDHAHMSDRTPYRG